MTRRGPEFNDVRRDLTVRLPLTTAGLLALRQLEKWHLLQRPKTEMTISAWERRAAFLNKIYQRISSSSESDSGGVFSQDELSRLAINHPFEICCFHAANTADDIKFIQWLLENQYANCAMVEGDAVLVADQVVMGHPPVWYADLRFIDWVKMLAQIKPPLLIKVDFKNDSVIEGCLRILQQQKADGIISHSLVLNADVLTGPGGGNPVIQPVKFLQLCREKLPGELVSLSWTTGYNGRGYTPKMMEKMLQVAGNIDLVTLAVNMHHLFLAGDNTTKLNDSLTRFINSGQRRSVTAFCNRVLTEEEEDVVLTVTDPTKTIYALKWS